MDVLEAVRRIDKATLLDKVIAHVDAELEVAAAAQRATADGATHEESKAENDKDTRALESSYLARGQAQRVMELSEQLALLRRVTPREFTSGDASAASALLVLEGEDDEVEVVWLLPGAAGFELEACGVQLRVVTLKSPLGRALVGCYEDDDVEVRVPKGVKRYSVAAVC